MIFVKQLFNTLIKNKISFFTGVPDSVLKNLTSCFGNLSKKKHIIAANEGSAISIGIGYYLSTKKIPCVYLQNAGLVNAINPLVSIAHKKVYSIPMLLMIGWRGSYNKKDEPQHMVKGKITPQLLNLLDIRYSIIRKTGDLQKLKKLISFAKSNNTAVACLIEKDVLKIKTKNKKSFHKNRFELRQGFIYELLKNVPKNCGQRKMFQTNVPKIVANKLFPATFF